MPSPRQSVTAWVALGANLGDAAATLRQAVRDLGRLPGTSLGACSGLYRTAPIDSGGGDYLNAVVAVHTRLTAPGLLDGLQAIEHAAGRERPYRNAPRTLDLDLIFYGDARIDSPRLTVPHPRWAERAFVLVPLAEIAPARVTQGQLDLVAGQAITRLGPLAA